MAPGLPEHPDHLIRHGTTRHDCKSILELRPPTDASRVQTHICDKEGFSSPKSPLLQPGRVPKAPTMSVGGGCVCMHVCACVYVYAAVCPGARGVGSSSPR